MEIFFMMAGVLFAYTRHYYILVIIAMACFIGRRVLWLFFFVIAIGYAQVHQWWAMPDFPVQASVITKAVVVGRIVSIPNKTAHKTQFQFRIQELDGKPLSALVLLSWYNHPPLLTSGQSWQLVVKLKKARNLNNPGAFNFIQWLSSRHMQWTGYVKSRSGILLSSKTQTLDHYREQLGQTLQTLSPNQQVSGIVEALSLGLTGQIDSKLWDLFRRTGTTHLMVISGAHIGLIAGMSFGLFKWLWSRSAFLCLRWPAIRVGAIAGLFAAFVYALLAGFAVPAQRALVGCVFFTLQCLSSKKYSSWQIWRYALLFVLLFEPHSVLMPGFYLSFMAVAAIMIASHRWQFSGLKKILLIQISCLIGLMPLCLFWFSYGSIIGFIANLVAIPFVGFCIVPLALITLLCLHWDWAWLLMKLLSVFVTCLLKWLNWVDAFSVVNLTLPLSQVLVPLLLLSALALLVIMPVNTYRVLVVALMLIAISPPKQRIKAGEILIHVLDVGQGLAVVLQMKDHVLIYDTGDKFYQGSDMGELAILPFLRAKGISRIDKVIISHPDKDHRGGLQSLEAGIKVDELIVDNPGFYHRGVSCHRYAQWQWENIEFQFFPIKKRFKGKNNHSCVLQIRHPNGRVLLTGDIEKKAEQYLVDHYGDQLQSEYMLVPHHGSKTSSSIAFLKTVHPKYALASLGFDNRFHFPHAQTLAHYLDLAMPVYMTKDCGMITVKLSKDRVGGMPSCYI